MNNRTAILLKYLHVLRHPFRRRRCMQGTSNCNWTVSQDYSLKRSLFCLTKSQFFPAAVCNPRFYSKKDDDGEEYPLPKTRRKTMSERTRVMADKTKEMSERTKDRIRETRAVVKDKLDGMRENIFTYPNGLCVLRIALTPVMGYCVLEHHHVAALSLFLVAGLTDLLDGYIARTFPSQKSVLGSLLDPVADKLLVAASFLTLTIDNLIPIPLTVLIISRDVILVVCGVYIRYNSLPVPKSIPKFFDFSMATAEMKPTFISKVNTVVQLTLICSTLASPIFSNLIHHDFLQVLWWTTAGTTLFSGLGYLSMRGYRVIRTKDEK